MIWHESPRDGSPSRENAEEGHFAAGAAHLANVAYRSGNQRLVFDAATETFQDNEAANRFLKPHYRGEYRVPEEV